jgi:hypothetical protein
MKKYFAFLLLIAVASIAFIALADAPVDKNPSPPADIQTLKNQIAELQNRVQRLEDQTRSLESTVHTMQQPRLVPLLGQPGNRLLLKKPPVEPQPPKIWGQKQVNGWTFYVVPCEQAQ